jgi:hypothetical protein
MEGLKTVMVTVNYSYRNSLKDPLKKDNLMHEVTAASRPKVIDVWFNEYFRFLNEKFGENNWFCNKITITGDENPRFWY